MVTCCTVNGSTPGTSLFGHKANLDIDATGGKVNLVPQREFGDEIDPETFAKIESGLKSGQDVVFVVRQAGQGLGATNAFLGGTLP